MTFENELDIYLKARFTLIVLVTKEEERALKIVKSVCEKSGRPCMAWDVAEGFQPLGASKESIPAARDAISALEYVDKSDGNTLFIMKDFHDCWSNPQFRRKLRNVTQRLKMTKKSIMVTCPSHSIPEELKDEAVEIDLPPPNIADLEAVLNPLTQIPNIKVQLTQLGREKLV